MCNDYLQCAHFGALGIEMAKFLDLSVNGIALGAVSGGTNQTQAQLTTTTPNVLQLSGSTTSTLCRISGVDQPQADTDAANYLQTYVLGQIRGLQMKPSVSLASTVPVSLSASVTTRPSLHWPGPYTATTGVTDLWSTNDDLGRNASTANNFLSSSGNMTMSCGFIFTPTVAHTSGLNGPKMFWTFNGSQGYGSGDEGGIGLNCGDPTALIFNSFTATGGNVSANNPPTTYNDMRYAWTTVTPGVQYCFLWTYTRYLTGVNAPGVMSITWGTLANGIVTPVPDYRNGVSFQSKGGVLPSGFGGSAAATPESNWLLQSMRLTYGSWSSSEVNFFVAPTILSLQDAFVTQWQPPPPGWLASGIDGVVPTANTRILLTGETTESQNGIWQVNSAQTALIRPPDFLTGANAAANFVFVKGPGLTNNDQGYLCTSLPGQDVVDTNSTTWVQYTSEGGTVGSLQMGTDSITAASGALSFVNNNLTTTGTVTSTAAVHGSLAIQAGNIYDSSGQINFNTDNLVTSGAIKAATLTVGAGSIVDSTGAISLGTTNLATTGAMTAPHFLTVSDERLKTVTADLEITPDIYAALHPVCFNWKASGQADVGLIAQELQAVAPQVVSKDSNSPEGYLYVDYAAVVPYALAIAKGATDRVAALEARVAALEPETTSR